MGVYAVWDDARGIAFPHTCRGGVVVVVAVAVAGAVAVVKL